MSILNKIKQTGIIRITLSFVFFAILFVALLDVLHPSSRLTLSRGVVVFLSLISALVVAFFALRARTLPYPQSMKHAVLALFSIGLILRTGVVVLFPNKQVSDFQIYHELAVALLDGKGFAYDGKTGLSEDAVYYLHLNGATGPIPTALRMPGTPLLMAAVYKVFGPHPLAAKLLNALLGTGIGICLLLLLWEIHPRKAFWAGLIWEIYPSTLFYTNLLGTEIHFTFGVVLAALLLTKTIAGNDNCPLRRALVAGLVIGCTCLIRPSTQFILCVMAVSVWYVWQQKRKIDRAFWKKTLPVAGFLMLGIAIPLSWWGYRNYRTFGEFEWQATEIGWGFFYMTQNYLSPQEEQPLDSLLTVFSRSQNEFEIARLAKEIGIRRLCRAAVKPAFVKTLIWNFLSLWRHDKDGLSWCLEFPETGTHPENAGNPAIASMYIALQRIIETGYLTICILAFFGAIGLQRREIRNPGVITMLLYFFGTCILFCVFHGQPRYHFPFMPLFCILAANSMGALRSVPRFPWLKSL